MANHLARIGGLCGGVVIVLFLIVECIDQGSVRTVADANVLLGVGVGEFAGIGAVLGHVCEVGVP